MKWIKFDLHQHTRNEIPVDRSQYKSTYTHESFFKLVKSQGVKLKAVTNHNVIDVIDHIKYALICKKIGVSYIPGVEIDYKFEGKRFQAISILNPAFDIISFSNKLSEIICEKDLVTLDKDEFSKLHENYEFILIPHYAKKQGLKPKKDVSLEDEKNWVVNMIQSGQSIPVIFENTQEHHKYLVYSVLKSQLRGDFDYAPSYTGTDSKFDDDVKREKTAQKRLIYMMHAEPTYRGFEISVRNHNQRISSESQTITRNNYIREISFSENTNFENTNTIELSPSLNVIVGSSGSGKTLLLNEIFYTLESRTMRDVCERNDKKNKVRPYFERIGVDNWLNVKTKNPSVPLKVIEIPSVYEMLLSNLDDQTVLGNLFGINDITKTELILKMFIENIETFESNLSDILQQEENGKSNLIDIISGTKYINENSKKEDFVLTEKPKNDIKHNKLKKKLSDIKTILEFENNINTHIDQMVKAIGTEDARNLGSIILSNYDKLRLSLIKKNEEIVIKEKKENANQKIDKIINSSIAKQVLSLGERTKTVNIRTTTVGNKKNALVKNVLAHVKIVLKNEKMDIVYPLEDIKQSLLHNNSNEFARYQCDLTDKDIESVILSESKIIQSTNIIIKLRTIEKKLGEVNLKNNFEIINLIHQMYDEKLKLSELVNEKIKIRTQLNVKGAWRNINEINPGDISKISMHYYFDNIITHGQPDVILIDQPENDLDKDFITNILSDFIKKAKMEHQIIITSHDPILTVNSDVNTIIEAKVTKDNLIQYDAFNIESIEDGKLVTDKVAKILDGSKKNIMNRYNIYGGIKRYED